MGKKQQKSPVKPSKAGSVTKPAKGKASVKKRPASAAAVRDVAIDEAEQKRSRMQENLWALEKQVQYSHACIQSCRHCNDVHIMWQEGIFSLEYDHCVLCLQIYDIETRYLTDANPRGNAVRGERPMCPGAQAISCSGCSRQHLFMCAVSHTKTAMSDVYCIYVNEEGSACRV